MATITYIHSDDRIQEIEVADGTSVMRAALEHGVDGIVGECGGQAMCATCHVYVDEAASLPEISDDEDEMLDCTACERTSASRLGCQLRAGLHFSNIAVRVPERQV
ncbi:2Fe-2S iron-sulfur cluster-binding protein [Agrococcus citreus]|uniref:2Fe-2S iron-sulfur cluster-binding protein n=1 Tax=Agrococcus citreus TaxID=84643 RepID=A0ABN1YQN3_9MICO